MELREQLQETLSTAYALERELGGGGMSRVFVAEERALGRKVVVKVLPPTLSGGVNIERFKREIQVAARLQHAHIVPVLTAGETHGLPYYTMPFVDGESLRGRLARGALPVTETVSILRDVSRALAYAHDHGVVHRDIKPDNVMLAGGSAVVTDFGIAKAISASRTDSGNSTLTSIGTSLGTPAYMAPEQAAADPATDHRADLYAFGCMAYEMLVGTPPFVEKSPQQLLAAHMAKTPEPVTARRPDTPPLLATLVMKCLEKDAALRPVGAAEIGRTLETVTSGGAHQAMPPILLSPRASLWRALAIYAAAFFVAVLLAKAAIVAVGLPDWVLPGTMIVMLLGLPVILFTAYVQRVTRRTLTSTPTYTPGGTPATTHGTLATMAMKASPHMSWRRTAIGGAYALGAFMLLIIAFMGARAMGIGPAGSLLASGKLAASDQILVADFVATGADSALGGVLAEAMRSSLSQSKRVRVVPASTIAGALQRMQRPVTSKLDLALANEIAQREGVKAIVAGEVTSVGGGYFVTAKLLSAATGDVLTSYQQSANGATGLIPAMDQLGRQLRGKIGESLRDVQSAPALARVATPSIEALRKFTEGARANDYESDLPKAIKLLDEAIALDSNFAMAYRKLSIALNSSGNARRASDVIAKGYTLRDRIPEAERLALLGVYYNYGPHDDRAKLIESYEELFRRHPEWLTTITPDLLASAYESRREFAKADSLWTLAIKMAPDENSPHYDVIRPRINRGDFTGATRAIAAARGATRLATSLAAVDRYEAGLLYNEGRVDSAAKLFERNARSPLAANARLGKSDLASLSLQAGRLAEWNRRAAAIAPPAQANVNPNETGLGVNIAARVLDQPDEARRRLDAILKRRGATTTPAPPAQLLNDASLEAQAGRVDKARALLARFGAEVTDTVVLREQSGNRHFTLGWLAIAEGRAADAVKEFRAADRLPDGPLSGCSICIDPFVGLAFDRANMPDSAIATFEHFVGTPFVGRHTPDALNLAWILRRLGELYEAKGNTAKARENYQKFVDLWKNADPELQPKVADVRSRLRRLDEAERRTR